MAQAQQGIPPMVPAKEHTEVGSGGEIEGRGDKSEATIVEVSSANGMGAEHSATK